MTLHGLRLLICGFVLAATARAESAEWFRTAGSHCSGQLPLGAALSAWIGPGPAVVSGDGPGNYFVSIPISEMRKGEVITQRLLLNGQHKKSLSDLLLSYAADVSVPTWFDIGGDLLISIKVPDLLSGAAVGFLFDAINEKMNATSVELRRAALFLAEGGSVYRRVTPLKRTSDSNRFVSFVEEYSVQLGKEMRIFSMHGCIYPARIGVSQFRTTGPLNNKIMKEVSAGQWRTWDVDNNRFEGDPFKYEFQREGFFYLTRDGATHRWSFDGGPWQKKDGSSWSTFYQNITAE